MVNYEWLMVNYEWLMVNYEPIPLFVFELRNPIFSKNRIS